MRAHTKEPWVLRTIDNSLGGFDSADGSVMIGHVFEVSAEDRLAGHPVRKENAFRVVTCVNACAGIDNGDLEKVTYAELLESHQTLESQLADATRKLEEARKALDTLDLHMQHIGGCSNHGCVVVKRTGAVTTAAL